MKERGRSATPDAEDALLAAQQALVAVEHELSAQRGQQNPDAEHEQAGEHRRQLGEREQVAAAEAEAPAGPRRGAGEVELDARAASRPDLHRAEPVEHVRSVRCCRAVGYPWSPPSETAPPPPL